jgi:hypothetical protein
MYFQNHIKLTKTICEQKSEFPNVTAGDGNPHPLEVKQKSRRENMFPTTQGCKPHNNENPKLFNSTIKLPVQMCR